MPNNSLAALVEFIARGADVPADAKDLSAKKLVSALFGQGNRYYEASRTEGGFRDAYGLRKDDGVPYAGVTAPENPDSGPYGGASIAWFPCADGTLMTFVVGTRGLSPDEGLLTRHGHRRRVMALRNHLSRQGVNAWAKADPAAISMPLPEVTRRQFPGCDAVFQRYGSFIYSAAWVPRDDHTRAELVVRSYFDLYARERGWRVLKEVEAEFVAFQETLDGHAFPSTSVEEVNDLLRQRRFVILQGPPGTGKTRMAEAVRREFFGGRGRTIQFHPAVTYEDFVVGLSPDPSDDGLRFRPKAGWLLQAAAEAADQPYLLVIDEINRGDLGKVLGEAIYLFEPGEAHTRCVDLAHSVNGTSSLSLPAHLFVLGTMNTADRSIASLDLAVRRRFAFVTLMPDIHAISLPSARAAFSRLMEVFVEHASDEALHLLPGHSYFIASDDATLWNKFRHDLLPLLDEYLRQGLMGPATFDLHAVREWIADQAVSRAKDA